MPAHNGHGNAAQNSGANDDGFFGNNFLYNGNNAYFHTFGANAALATQGDFRVEGLILHVEGR